MKSKRNLIVLITPVSTPLVLPSRARLNGEAAHPRRRTERSTRIAGILPWTWFHVSQ